MIGRISQMVVAAVLALSVASSAVAGETPSWQPNQTRPQASRWSYPGAAPRRGPQRWAFPGRSTPSGPYYPNYNNRFYGPQYGYF